MADSIKVKNCNLRLLKGDITDFDIESFVYYATEDLALGSGFGTAIAVRGGPTIQKELNEIGKIKMTEVVISAAGEMKAKYIVHANGPKFQEEDLPEKLKTTIINSLKRAEEKGIKAIAFPPMGAGFYGVPLDQSAEITLTTIKEYLSGEAKLDDVVVCLNDRREYIEFEKKFSSLK
ncbi:MAG: O-acetyl-ADP-ribose deacetylase [candidate division Zixibacteria bacterium]|nr:O-acetyl-ADP-ribose deacetylase [candidate division Zixibacteria bacterium]